MPGVRQAGRGVAAREGTARVNLFGIGNLELVAILVVALMILGPGKMVETARTLGKFWAEAQRTLRSVADAATVRLDEPPSLGKPASDPVAGPEDAVARPGGGPDEEPEEAVGPGGAREEGAEGRG